MPRRYFTVGEVETLIPTLERLFVQVLQLRAGLRALEAKLDRAGVQITREELLDDDSGPVPVRQAKAVFRGLYESLADVVEQVRALGGEVKDFELGLVDFPGRRGSEQILLCWKLGEKSIGFWHPVDAGFAGRRPIDELIPRAPQHLD